MLMRATARQQTYPLTGDVRFPCQYLGLSPSLPSNGVHIVSEHRPLTKTLVASLRFVLLWPPCCGLRNLLAERLTNDACNHPALLCPTVFRTRRRSGTYTTTSRHP